MSNDTFILFAHKTGKTDFDFQATFFLTGEQAEKRKRKLRREKYEVEVERHDVGQNYTFIYHADFIQKEIVS